MIQLTFRILNAVRTPKVLLLWVWPLPRSLATTSGISFDFSSSGYLDVSVPQVPHIQLLIHCMFHDSSSWVFPHSEICGSKLICSSPQLIAAYHVLHRLPMPRHSPYALLRLNYFLYIWRYTIGSRLSRLNCCVSYLQFKTFYRLWQNCFFLPFTEKPDFILQILLCGLWFPVSLYFVCHVCHIHSFKESICHFSYSVFNEHSF